MQNGWLARLFFAVVAALAVAGVVSGTACTRWGHPGPVPPTITPLMSIYVDAETGSDTSGNGSIDKPFKTLTKAVEVLDSSKSLSTSGVTIYMSPGDYDAANGEKFPIVIPTSVSLMGSGFGAGPTTGTFVNGQGEDTIFEKLVHAAPHSAYATLVVVAPASVSITDVYLGASKISLRANAFYASLDDIGTVSGTTSSFGAGVTSRLRNVNAIIEPGGTLTCASCLIRGNDFGIGAFSIPAPSPSASPYSSASPYTGTPSITLSHSTTDSTIGAKIVDILTDGSANVTASGEHFERGEYAYNDSFKPVVPTTVRGTIDFGGGAASSTGGNVFIGAHISEIFVTRRFETISALDDTWNPNEQKANRFGQYARTMHFGAGAKGQNVTIYRNATGSTVTVGPAPVPTPTPSITPSVSPSPTPT
jgi:hypothetical protein